MPRGNPNIAAIATAYSRSPEGRKSASKRARRFWKDPKRRKRHSARMKKLWADPDQRLKFVVAQQFAPTKPHPAMVEAAKRTWRNPKIRKARCSAMRGSKRKRGVGSRLVFAKKRVLLTKQQVVDILTRAYILRSKSYHDPTHSWAAIAKDYGRSVAVVANLFRRKTYIPFVEEFKLEHPAAIIDHMMGKVPHILERYDNEFKWRCTRCGLLLRRFSRSATCKK